MTTEKDDEGNIISTAPVKKRSRIVQQANKLIEAPRPQKKPVSKSATLMQAKGGNAKGIVVAHNNETAKTKIAQPLIEGAWNNIIQYNELQDSRAANEGTSNDGVLFVTYSTQSSQFFDHRGFSSPDVLQNMQPIVSQGLLAPDYTNNHSLGYIPQTQPHFQTTGLQSELTPAFISATNLLRFREKAPLWRQLPEPLWAYTIQDLSIQQTALWNLLDIIHSLTL